MQVRSPGEEDPLEEEMATYSSILAWKIPWTEDPDLHRVTESDITEHMTHTGHLIKEDIQVQNHHVKRYSSLYVFRDLKNEMTERHHYI